MSIQAYMRVMRRHYVLIAVLTALGALAGFGITAAMPKVYVATTTQFVRGVPGAGASADYQAAQFAVARAKSYSVMIGNPDVLTGIIEDLDLTMSPTTLYSRLTVDNPIDTTLINVTARGRTADEAQILSVTAADNLAKFILRLESAGTTGGKSPIDIQTAVPAPKPRSPSSPRPPLNIAVGTMLGLAAGSIAALARDVRNQNRSRRDDDDDDEVDGDIDRLDAEMAVRAAESTTRRPDTDHHVAAGRTEGSRTTVPS